jgi:hypothetical protein
VALRHPHLPWLSLSSLICGLELLRLLLKLPSQSGFMVSGRLPYHQGQLVPKKSETRRLYLTCLTIRLTTQCPHEDILPGCLLRCLILCIPPAAARCCTSQTDIIAHASLFALPAANSRDHRPPYLRVRTGSDLATVPTHRIMHGCRPPFPLERCVPQRFTADATPAETLGRIMAG